MALSERSVDVKSWIWTKDVPWTEVWDGIQKNDPNGMFTQTSSWLGSYKAYGIDYELLLKVEDDQIVAGFGNLIFKAGPFLAYICPWGPFLTSEAYLQESIDVLIQRAKSLNAFCVQVNPSVFEDEKDTWNLLFAHFRFERGKIFRKIYLPTDFNLIELKEGKDSISDPQLLKSFSENAKRNIKAGLKISIDFHEAQTLEEIRAAYECFESNAAREGYSIRNWRDIKESLVDGVSKGNYQILLAEYNGEIMGAIWTANGGLMKSYIMGGVDRSKGDLKLGHLLQWFSIKNAVELGYGFYNISVGGSDGVVRFKKSFYPKAKSSIGPYFLKLNKWKFFFFISLFPVFEKNKRLAAFFMKLLR
ncbi:lipid II:glycine glycyltransferase FemX [Algoriphagus limi]|uniref:Aminoacyltransferase n=1 Tax=Algoriphagus limi TaxID=2975273 RepID=A0ABT2G150_9BACT|nr:aminoacyltransferase [Algoriphagus limi]MCS5488989.1 aminoacyltransferase [Algoriphagus limi]